MNLASYSLFLQQARLNFNSHFIYKINTLFSIIGNFMHLIISIAIWTALFSGRDYVAGITLQQTLTFVVVGSLLRSLTGGRTAYDMASKISDGSIGSYFVRPISLKYTTMAEKLGDNAHHILFSGIPLVAGAILIIGISIPSALHVFLFAVSIVLSFILMFYIDFVMSLFTFWLKSGLHINFFMGAIFRIFSGAEVPLWFYPDAFRRVCEALPFRLIIFEPTRIFMGMVDYREAVGIILLQLLWIVVLVIVEKLIWKEAQKVVTIQGG